MKYAIVLRELPPELGGGYQGFAPDLRGCMSDGETIEEALANTMDAVSEWIAVCEQLGRPIPEPNSSQKRAIAREQALIDTIKVLSEQYDGLDDRIESLQREIERLGEVMENRAAWSRFDVLIEPMRQTPSRNRLSA